MIGEISLQAYMGTWASARTLFTFCVNENEIGKIYASVGIMASVAPLISDPMFRTLYNKVIYILTITNCMSDHHLLLLSDQHKSHFINSPY